MLDHALQSAALASADDAGADMVLACLLHDIGHVLGDAGQWGDPGHGEVGARALQAWFDPGVVEPIRGHVDAKRYRVAVDPEYHEHLSLASQMSLAEQGGPFTPRRPTPSRPGPLLRRPDNCGPSTTTGRLRGSRSRRSTPIDPCWRSTRSPPSDRSGVGPRRLPVSDLSRPRQRPTPHRCDCVGRVDDRLVSPSRGELRVVLHHESGERHECRIPLAVRSSVDPDPWPIDAADELRHTSTDWNDDHGPFVEHLARRGSHSSMAAGSSPARC